MTEEEEETAVILLVPFPFLATVFRGSAVP